MDKHQNDNNQNNDNETNSHSQNEDKSKHAATEVAKILLEIKAVTLNSSQPYTYASGMKSPIYCDNRLLMSYPDRREKIIQYFLEAIRLNKLEFDAIGGIATAGIPHAAWLAQQLGVPMIYVRSEAKEHGKQNQIEGRIEEGQRVLMIEDHISTGGSSVNAIKAAREAGAVVNDCLSVTTYELDKAKKAFSDADCNAYSLTNFTEIVGAAEKMKYINEKEKNIILEWNKDPQNWAGKHGLG